MKRRVTATGGWQATQLKVTANQKYQFATSGTWQTHPTGEAVSADGETDAQGRLIAAVLSDDLELSDPFDLGGRGEFDSPSSGQLYVPCQDKWTELGDNEGEITLHLRLPKTEK